MNYKLTLKPNKTKSGNFKSNLKKPFKDLMILEMKKWLHKRSCIYNKKLKNMNLVCSTKPLNSVLQAMIIKLQKCSKDR